MREDAIANPHGLALVGVVSYETDMDTRTQKGHENVLWAAIRFVRERYGIGGVEAIAREGSGPADLGSEQLDTLTVRAAAALSLPVVNKRQHQVCGLDPKGRSRCTLVGVNMIYTAHILYLDPAAARIIVGFSYVREFGQVATAQAIRLDLERVNGTWKISKVGPRVIG